MDFYYSYGPVETTTPWDRPTWDTFYEWWDEFKQLEGVSDYEFYISGSSLVDIENTWDIDVIVTGNIKDFVSLSRLIQRGRELGFEKKIYIDMIYYNSIEFCYGELTEESRKYYLKGRLGGTETKVVNGVVEFEYSREEDYSPYEELGSDLIFYYVRYPGTKHFNNKERYSPTNRVKKLEY